MFASFANTRRALAAALLPLCAALAVPAGAQTIETVDPDLVIDGDLSGEGQINAAPQHGQLPPDMQSGPDGNPAERYATGEVQPSLDLPPDQDTAPPANVEQAVANPSDTYAEDDLIGAAEGLFGRGAEGLARLIQNILKDQGEPNAYIVGREGGGAFVLGVRYGSGTLFHKVEGNQPVYWTGPSIGLDAGANAGNTFVLVYNLFDSEELYERFPAGEGQAYFVGGFNASYVRKGDIVLIPIRVGAGLRLGVNAGYMKFSHKQTWLPF